MPIALPTPGTAGQSALPITSQFLAGSIPTNSQLATTPLYSQSNTPLVPNTNTSQNSSWLSAIEGYPGDIASTFGNLISPITTVFNPGTPGGAPLAGGQFPYNYPFTQTDINRLALTNPALAQGIQSQYNQLRLLSGTAYPITMPNAAYEYLGSPSPTGPIFPNLNPEALKYATPEQLKALQANYNLAGLEIGALAPAPEYVVSVGPATAAAYGLTGAGISGTINPLLTYAFSKGKATPQQSGINTNTAQSSSNNAPWYTLIPGEIASTFGNLINWAITSIKTWAWRDLNSRPTAFLRFL